MGQTSISVNGGRSYCWRHATERLRDNVLTKYTGGMAEWPKAAVLKTAERKRSGGSNPSPSVFLICVG